MAAAGTPKKRKTGSEPPFPFDPEARRRVLGLLSSRLYRRASLWGAAFFVPLVVVLLRRWLPYEPGLGWFSALLGLIVACEAVAMLLTFGHPFDYRAEPGAFWDTYLSAVGLSGWLVAGLVLFGLWGSTEGGGRSLALLVASALAMIPLTALRAALPSHLLTRGGLYLPAYGRGSGAAAERHIAESAGGPTVKHWLGLVLLLIAAAASWHLLVGGLSPVASRLFGELDLLRAGGDPASRTSVVAGSVLALAVLFPVVGLVGGYTATPQLFLVAHRATEADPGLLRYAARAGVPLAATLLAEIVGRTL